MKTLHDFHPIVLLFYFIAVIGLTMFYMHPILLCISFIGAISLSLLVQRQEFFTMVKWFVPFMIIAALINPLITHDGELIILYVNGQPITIEAIVYGFAMSMMLLSVMFWFGCLNKLMTSDKFLYLFNKISPAFALLLTITMRLIPLFFHQIKRITQAQKMIGMDITSGSIKQRIQAAVRIMSILISWALENAIETADSMKARGYGLKNRSTFSIFSFDRNDAGVLGIIVVLFVAQIWSSSIGWNDFTYYPTFSTITFDFSSYFVFTSYVLLIALPIFIEIQEVLKWRSLKSIN
ncbi:MAG: energy-coupling factor transporter transmembrane protein EcfT [Kurthia sp.]|nr:energy-coupling factor transporter transmembrane protein EcfT [Candidatus Kurthia equi]